MCISQYIPVKRSVDIEHAVGSASSYIGNAMKVLTLVLRIILP